MRDGIAVGLAVIAVLLLAVGNVAVWASEAARDPETYADAQVLDLGPGGLEGMIQQRLTDAVVDAVDIDGIIQDNLPGPLAAFGTPAEDLGRQVIDETITSVLSQPGVTSLIDRIESASDEELVALLLDESTYLRLDGDMVVLDLDPLIEEVAVQIDDFIPDGLAEMVPVLSSDTIIPDDLQNGGIELELIELPALADAVESLDTLDQLAEVLPIAGGIAALAAFAVARRRSRLAIILGLGSTAAVVLVAAGAMTGAGNVLGNVTEPLEAIAGQSLGDAQGGVLMSQTAAVAFAGLVVAAAGWLVSVRTRRPATVEA